MCHTCVDFLDVSGAGVMLMAQRTHQGTLFGTDDTIRSLEDLQNAAGEGPCIDAHNLGRPVLEPDLAGQGERTWPTLAASALDVGMQAVFAFPLQLDDTSFGALDLYRDHPSPLSPEQIADARLLAAMVAREVLAMQADAPRGSLSGQVADLSGDRVAIEQATGMVSAQLDTTVIQAGRDLRAYARVHDRSLAEVARDIVARRLRLGD